MHEVQHDELRHLGGFEVAADGILDGEPQSRQIPRFCDHRVADGTGSEPTFWRLFDHEEDLVRWHDHAASRAERRVTTQVPSAKVPNANAAVTKRHSHSSGTPGTGPCRACRSKPTQ